MEAIFGNEKAKKYLTDSLNNGSVSHAYLFYGPLSVGKTKTAMALGRKLLCEKGSEADCDCSSCHLLKSGNHPDFHIMDGGSAGIDDVRELIQILSLKPYQSAYRVAVISHAENMSLAALNSFLKTLEEPNDNTVIIITTENRAALLETIVSRTRQVSFGIVEDHKIFEYLNQECGVKKELARELVAVSSGRVGIALALSENGENAATNIQGARNFIRLYQSDSIADKLSLANKLSGLKVDLANTLSTYTAIIREMMIASVDRGKETEIQTMVAALDGLAKVDSLLKRNINAKLAIEAVLLRSI